MIYIDKSSAVPIYEQLYYSLTNAIHSGSFAPGSKLPATRYLSDELAISRNSVNRAYHQLEIEGYVYAKAGSGFIVNEIPSVGYNDEFTHIIHTLPAAPALRYDFDYGNIDNLTFPYKQWRKSVNRTLDSVETCRSILYPDYMGEAALREEIARYLYRSRSVICNPEQVVITCGHQHSVEILANIFESSQKRCGMEDPGYDGIRSVFCNHHYQMHYIPVENDGLDISETMSRPLDLLYVTPSHQFPTGAVLSISKRISLLEWAHNTGAYIIEDDYDSELRYYTNPAPSLQSLDHNERVIYTGTFSKALSPAIRIAYIVLPHALLPRYHEYYHLYGSQVSPLHQLALADFMANGSFERNINRLRTLYRKKQDLLKTAMNEVFGDQITISGDGAGLHLLVNIDTSTPPEILIEKASSCGIKLYSVKPYYANPSTAPKCQLQFGFPTIAMDDYRPVLMELKKIWE